MSLTYKKAPEYDPVLFCMEIEFVDEFLNEPLIQELDNSEEKKFIDISILDGDGKPHIGFVWKIVVDFF